MPTHSYKTHPGRYLHTLHIAQCSGQPSALALLLGPMASEAESCLGFENLQVHFFSQTMSFLP